jgi:hypothetical protein
VRVSELTRLAAGNENYVGVERFVSVRVRLALEKASLVEAADVDLGM